MRYRHSFEVDAPLTSDADFHASASSLDAITPPVIPMRLHHEPERMGAGDENVGATQRGRLTMWPGLPLLFAYRGWQTRNTLESC
jgi:hypothetical protein